MSGTDPAPARRSRWRGLRAPGGAILTGLAVRLLLVAGRTGPGRFLFVDSDSYLVVAKAMPRVLWSSADPHVADSIFRTPGYPALVWLVGGAGHPLLAILAQVLLGAVANVWLCHRLGLRLAGPRAAAIAAWIVALDPAMVGHDLLIATETLTTTLLLLVVLAGHELWRRAAMPDGERAPYRAPTWSLALAAGLACGGMALVRPVMAPFVLAVPLAVVIARRTRAAAIAAVLMAAIGLVVIGGWYVRNVHVAHAHMLTSATSYNVLDLGTAAAAADAEGGLSAAFHPSRYQPHQGRLFAAIEAKAGDDRSADHVAGIESREGRRLVAHHPVAAAAVVSRALGRAWAAPGGGLIRSHLPSGVDRFAGRPITGVALAWIVLLDLAALWGAVVAVRRRRWALLVVTLGPVLLTMAGSAFPALYLRMRVPVMPFVAILAASALARIGAGPAAVSAEEDGGVADPVGVERGLDGTHGADLGG